MNLRERLLGLVAGDCHIHALLLAGAAESGQYALAERLAAMYCLHTEDVSRLQNDPDCIRIGDGGVIRVEDVRQITRTLSAQAFKQGRRAVLVRDAHRMNEAAQNAFLKTLEEPPAETLIVMNGNEAGLLPTIRSRCMIARLGAQTRESIEARLIERGVGKETARLAACWSDGAVERALDYTDADYAAFRSEAGDLLLCALTDMPPFVQVQALLGTDKTALAARAAALLGVWQSLLSDVLAQKNGLGGEYLHNPDRESMTNALAARFTSARIFCIIELLADTERRLSFRAAPAQSMDAALVRIRRTGEGE